jgi:hypothetical protein
MQNETWKRTALEKGCMEFQSHGPSRGHGGGQCLQGIKRLNQMN